MICVRVSRVCAFFLLLCISLKAFCKENNEGKSSASNVETTAYDKSHNDQFQWHEHYKLTWDDFRGAVNAPTEESAAATDCGIGFRTNTNMPDGKQTVIVYNTFYANKSWVRNDARISSILTHEQ